MIIACVNLLYVGLVRSSTSTYNFLWQLKIYCRCRSRACLFFPSLTTSVWVMWKIVSLKSKTIGLTDIDICLLSASFRGRILQGETVNIPDGYYGTTDYYFIPKLLQCAMFTMIYIKSISWKFNFLIVFNSKVGVNSTLISSKMRKTILFLF